MKKLIVLLLTLSMITTSSFINLSYAYSKTSNIKTPDTDKLISTYIYKDLDQLEKNVSFLAQNALNIKKENSPQKTEKFLKEINFELGEVDYEISRLKDEYEVYKDNSDISNALLVITIITTRFKSALNQIEYYIKASDAEGEYRSLDSYFRIMNEASSDINELKKYIKKQ